MVFIILIIFLVMGWDYEVVVFGVGFVGFVFGVILIVIVNMMVVIK